MKDSKIIEFLKWDSDFFGIKVGKIQLARGGFEKAEFTDEQNKEQYDLVYGFSSTDKTPNGFWESLGFYLVDSSVTLSMKFNPAKYRDVHYEHCINLSRDDINACYEISETVAPFSRFYNDPIIGKELTKKMYRKWIDTALDGSFSDCLFVQRKEGKIIGINAIKTDDNVGTVSLIGVRDGFLRQGIGKRLCNQSFGYWANNIPNVNLIKVRFSICNIPSFNFYIAMGFNVIKSTNYIYHYARQNKNYHGV